MSHAGNKTNVCPNCGFHTSHNYCAECGQQTHLHKETFWGLVLHFAEHYFHYDSKFRQTLKTLIVQPGMLTVAYWNNQRARYISPISLYIFISTIYFIITFWVLPNTAPFQAIEENRVKAEQLAYASAGAENTANIPHPASQYATLSFKQKFKLMMRDGVAISDFMEKVKHYVSKVFFFTLPFLGFFLQLLFYRRKDLLFVDHAVFSLHLHCMYFVVMLTQQLAMLTYEVVANIYTGISTIGLIFYAALAFRNVYHVSLGRGILYVFIVMLVYILTILAIALLSLYVYLQYYYHPH
ncbi:MAG TPA: DUF3667 domain-containing protein [Flavipsychrobacter sp.]|nr:DUF3667 domain-containing protein [Flavipsychrobacter sp.]